MSINTPEVSEKYRSRMIDVAGRRLLVSRIAGSQQEADLTEPTNVGGLGRIRHFHRARSLNWITNPLPIDPACKALALERTGLMTAQVFQNAACNWRCWYCYVPFELLAASPKHSQWVTAAELVAAYTALSPRPPILDLSGGQPELTPEWVLWTMDALEEAGIADTAYLWSDDNLSVDYYWTLLSARDRERIRSFKNYGRVGCFKGIDPESFAFNTEAEASRFDYQFELFRRYVEEGLDMYAYVTFVVPTDDRLEERMVSFVDSLQAINRVLPLRTVPLQVASFTPTKNRLDTVRQRALEFQYSALNIWQRLLIERFTTEERSRPISDIKWDRR
jgi:uncharacterized Fe-S cluster-containing radical SAM superfamily protein